MRHEQTKVPNEGVAENVKPEGRVVGKTGFIIDIDLKKYEKKKKKRVVEKVVGFCK